MPWRHSFCAEPGCGHVVRSGRCDEHRRAEELRRGTRAERNYGPEHRALRRMWQRRIDDGSVACTRCGKPISPEQAWDLGHDDHDRSKWTGPEHAYCNRSAGGRAARHSRRGRT